MMYLSITKNNKECRATRIMCRHLLVGNQNSQRVVNDNGRVLE
jgi:hypothetical protein